MTALYGIYGASGCGRGIMPLARLEHLAAGRPLDRLVFIDDGEGPAIVNGQRRVTQREFFAVEASTRHVAIAVANGTLRQKMADACAARGARFWSIAHPNVVVMDDVVIGEGALLSPFVTITSNIRIGRHFHANIGSHVEHDCVIGDYVTFAPGASCNGNIHIEDHAYIGAGALIKQGRPGAPRIIGRGAIVGMGAIVTRDVPPGAVVAGNPARPMPPRS